MNYEEMSSLLDYNEKENTVYIPNEIFHDLKSNIKTTPHISFAYTYIYFTTWLYRYAKYFNIKELIDNKKIKEVLGYNPKNQTVDYLIKKGGLLDEIGYTESTRNFPVKWEYKKDSREIYFTMYSDIENETTDNIISIPKRYFLKKPTKAFTRSVDVDDVVYEEDGTFYDVNNTHSVSFNIFMYCMSNSKIGCTGFYLYSFLKHCNDIHSNGIDISLDYLSNQTGIARRTLISYLDILKGYKMIDFKHNQDYFVSGLSKNERKANTYSVRDYELFDDNPSPYKKMTYKTKDEYERIIKDKEKGDSIVDNTCFFS